MHVTAEAKNPASCVTAGIARIPAPTYLQRKRRVSEVLWGMPIRGIEGRFVWKLFKLIYNVLFHFSWIWFASFNPWGNVLESISNSYLSISALTAQGRTREENSRVPLCQPLGRWHWWGSLKWKGNRTHWYEQITGKTLRVQESSGCALPGSCSMVAWLRFEKRRSSCGGESGGCRSSAYWEQRHLRSGLLVPLLITRLGTGVLAETEEGRSRG